MHPIGGKKMIISFCGAVKAVVLGTDQAVSVLSESRMTDRTVEYLHIFAYKCRLI